MTQSGGPEESLRDSLRNPYVLARAGRPDAGWAAQFFYSRSLQFFNVPLPTTESQSDPCRAAQLLYSRSQASFFWIPYCTSAPAAWCLRPCGVQQGI